MRGQITIATMSIVAVTAAISAIATKIVDFPSKTSSEIAQIRESDLAQDSMIDKICTYSINQTDRIDKNIIAIGKALKVEVVTGNEKENPCQK